MKQKWSRYGKKLVLISLFTQLSFCILVTLLFIETYPKLDDIERSWGKINSPYRLILYVSVLLKVSGEMLRGTIEMYAHYNNVFAVQREVLIQKHVSEQQRINPSMEISDDQRDEIMRFVRRDLGSYTFRKKRFFMMTSIYFESKLPIHPEFRCLDKVKTRSSTIGFFYIINWLSNGWFIIGQTAAIFPGIWAARVVLMSIIFIFIFEYAQLLLWCQTHKKVGRFLSSVVNILNRDIIGFAVVFVTVQVAFAFCFLLLEEVDVVGQRWARAFFIFYELSVGTGEWYKARLDELEIEYVGMDPFRKALLYLGYIIYISITLVILMNLLIAVMTETASSMTSQMRFRNLNLKLSSVALVSRRLRAAGTVAGFFGIGCCCSLDRYTVGGETGKTIQILAGRQEIREQEARMARMSTWTRNSPEVDNVTELVNYFYEMRYWSVLEHEPLKDTREVKCEACRLITAKMKELYDDCSVCRDNNNYLE